MLGGGSVLQEVSDVSVVSIKHLSLLLLFFFFSEQQQHNQRKGKMLNL